MALTFGRVVATVAISMTLCTGAALATAPNALSDNGYDPQAGSAPAVPRLVTTADPWYVPPRLRGDERAGTLLRAEAITPQLMATRYPNVTGYRIMYVTTNAAGRAETATGVVLVPRDGRRTHDKLVAVLAVDDSLGAYCHPTTWWTGGSPADAPVAMLTASSTWEVLRRGAVAFIPDLGNGGGPAPTATMATSFAGRSVLAGLRAGVALPQSGLTADPAIGIFGPSGGGAGAAGVAAEQQSSYAPELRIQAVHIGQMVPDHRSFIHAIDGTVTSGFAFADLLGLEVQHPEMRVDDKLNPAGRAVAQHLRNSCMLLGTQMMPFLPLRTLFTDGISPADNPAFIPAFDAERIGAPNSPTPVAAIHITRCTYNDHLMSMTPVRDLASVAATYRDKGVDVTENASSTDCSGPQSLGPDLGWVLDRI